MNLGSALAIPSVSQRLDLLARSVRFLSCGKLKRASQLIAEVANSPSNDSDDLREMIAACQRLGIIVQSRKFLSKADVLLMSGDFENAFKKYLLIGIAGLPRDISFQVLHNKAVCLIRLNLFADAVEHFQEALLRYPKDTYCLQHLAFALMMNQDYSAALQVFSELIRIDEIKPENLLHILYGAAECRQRLNMGEHAGDMADHTLQAIQQHQQLHFRHQTGYFSDDNGDDESYNDYGLAEYGEEVLQNVSHVKYTGAPIPAAPAPAQGQAQAHIRATVHPPGPAGISRPSQSQFRRLRYQPVTKELPRGTLSIDTSLEKPSWSDDEGTQSPQLSVQSKQKREALRKAVGVYDRSVMVTSPQQQGQVRAAVPTLTHRVRGTDPSPGNYVKEGLVHGGNGIMHGGVTESPRDPERTGGGMSSSLSVSSSKPKLSKPTHRRYNTHVAFAHPVPPTPPPHTEKLNAKPEAIKVDARYPELPVEASGVVVNAGPKLAPANPMAAPMFVASPLPVPHWRPRERVSVAKVTPALIQTAPAPTHQGTGPTQPSTAAPLTTQAATSIVVPAQSTMVPQIPARVTMPATVSALVPDSPQIVSLAATAPLNSVSIPISEVVVRKSDFTSAVPLRRAPPRTPAPTEQLRLPTHHSVAATPHSPHDQPLTPALPPSAALWTQLEQLPCVPVPIPAEPAAPVTISAASTHASVKSVHNSGQSLVNDVILQKNGAAMTFLETAVPTYPAMSATNSGESVTSSSSSCSSLDLPTADVSPPLLSDLSSSEPPPSIKATVEVSYKPRRPSRGSVPDLDFSFQSAHIDRQQDMSPLVQPERPTGMLKRDHSSGTGCAFFGMDCAVRSASQYRADQPLQNPMALRDRPMDSLFDSMQVGSTAAVTTTAAPVLQPWSTQATATASLAFPSSGACVGRGGEALLQSKVHSSSGSDGGVKSRSNSATEVSVISAISAISTDSGSGTGSVPSSGNLTSPFRYNGSHTRAQPNTYVVSEQQQEMDRVFEGRRYVDNYTVTNADVMKLRAEFQRRFPSSSGPPTVTYPYAALRSPVPYPPDVDIRIREMYLSDADFQSLFHTSKGNWLSLPEWRQRSLKKSLELF